MSIRHSISRIFIYALCIVIPCVCLRAQTRSPKRGIGFDQNKMQAADFSALAPAVSWGYCWSTSTWQDTFGNGVAFVPMTWNGGYNAADLRQYLTAYPEVEYLLAFNEPNFRDQANMTPSAAAAAWGGLQAIADEFSLKLVSPAPNWCGYCVEENGTTYNSPYDWLRDFFAACPDCRVDYIAVHFYMGNRDAVKGSIEQLYNQFRKPIWLTEFNMDKNGMGDNGTVDEQRAFMVDMIDWMEQDSRIFRYAWFLTRGGILPDLLTSHTGELSLLGNVYANMSSYDTTFYHAVGRIEAEHYVRMQNVSLVESTDTDGNLSVGYTAAGSSMDYQIDIPAAGEYCLSLRTAGEQTTQIAVDIDGIEQTALTIPATGGWTTWQNVETTLSMPDGKHTLRIRLTDGSCDFNYLTLSSPSALNRPSSGNVQRNRKGIAPNGQFRILRNGVAYSAIGQIVNNN